ncbi:MAG: hypothetical protein KDA27_22770 [Candidatus Eisenbacteria bacterium]|uniref:WD40 repeat domain-containing protein n=1 Tax=Eiseniibacteriota bacterium TaxID=2212470 RepID=A0A956NGB3_UNCEI|nr:hypothetical protein [Candidatus Eisenbacteria bacterium]MCB9466538.1 hypothetical protein [Candidatus Eisenbacteria bacterium]
MTWAQAVLLIGTVLIVAFGSSCERERISVNDDEWEQVIPELPPPDSLLRAEDWQPACSPDGRRVAYSHAVKPGHLDEFGGLGIYVVEIGPEAVSPPALVVPVSGVRWLSFAPDSRRITYMWRGDIWIADVESHEVEQVTTHYLGAHPSWHPSKELIAYTRVEATSDPADSGSVRIIDLATLEDRPIRTLSGRVLYGGGTQWDRSGESVIYTRYDRTTRGSEVFRIFPDVSEEIAVTKDGWACSLPKWTFDGSEIVLSLLTNRSGFPEHHSWWLIDEDGVALHPFYDEATEVQVIGGNLAVGPGPGQFVVTQTSALDERHLALWIIGPSVGAVPRWRQITGLHPVEDWSIPESGVIH